MVPTDEPAARPAPGSARPTGSAGPRSAGPCSPGWPGSTPGAVNAALAEAGVHAGTRGASLRVSPHLWTTDQDVERLVGALTKATSGTVP
jgi:hypothetical protein